MTGTEQSSFKELGTLCSNKNTAIHHSFNKSVSPKKKKKRKKNTQTCHYSLKVKALPFLLG